MISKFEFEREVSAFVAHYELSLTQAADLLGVSKLRVYLYLTGWFLFDAQREEAVLERMDDYQFSQHACKLFSELARQKNGGNDGH
jgi:hypothetical protein